MRQFHGLDAVAADGMQRQRDRTRTRVASFTVHDYRFHGVRQVVDERKYVDSMAASECAGDLLARPTGDVGVKEIDICELKTQYVVEGLQRCKRALWGGNGYHRDRCQ